jgi:hypothetical protein
MSVKTWLDGSGRTDLHNGRFLSERANCELRRPCSEAESCEFLLSETTRIFPTLSAKGQEERYAVDVATDGEARTGAADDLPPSAGTDDRTPILLLTARDRLEGKVAG